MSKNDKISYLGNVPRGIAASSTPAGLPPGDKMVKVGRILFEQIGPEGVVHTKQFWLSGSPEDITDGAIRQIT